MGSNASKAARATPRKYPTTTPSTPTTPRSTNVPPSCLPSNSTHGPQVHPRPTISETRDHAINSDASDPDFPSAPHSAFSTRLRQIGPVQPAPILSHSSNASQARGNANPFAAAVLNRGDRAEKVNPTLLVLQSRKAIQERASREFEDLAVGGTKVARSLLDVGGIASVLRMREEGKSEGQIEQALGLVPGFVGRLGRGVVSAAQPVSDEMGGSDGLLRDKRERSGVDF